jgi:hypothetical protein
VEVSKMMKKRSISVAIGLLLASCLLGCQKAGNNVGVDEKEIQGFKTKTFFSNSENVEVTIASDGKSTIVAVPKTAISRQNEMGDDEYKCLKACTAIDDLERRLNCILVCPVTKQYNVFIFAASQGISN